MPLIDTEAVAVALEVTPHTVRNWASQGWLTRQGTDRRRRALYDTRQVETLARMRDAATRTAAVVDTAHAPKGH